MRQEASNPSRVRLPDDGDVGDDERATETRTKQAVATQNTTTHNDKR
jgi:hypothetical protein